MQQNNLKQLPMREQSHRKFFLGPHIVLQHQKWAERVHRALRCPLHHNCETNEPALLQNLTGTTTPCQICFETSASAFMWSWFFFNGKNESW